MPAAIYYLSLRKWESTPLYSPKRKDRLTLEVQSHYPLDQPAAGIIRCRSILVGSRETCERCSTSSTDGVDVVSRSASKEIDVVESIQHFSTEFQIHPFGKPYLLRDADIRPEEGRALEDQILETALA